MFSVELGGKLDKWYQETYDQLKWLKHAILGLKMDFGSVVKGQIKIYMKVWSISKNSMNSMEHDHAMWILKFDFVAPTW